MKLSDVAQLRYTTKAFDPAKRIPQETIDELLALLRLSPSSVNSQPWHFLVANSAEAKARIGKAMSGNFVYNAAKVSDASHVVVFCARTEMPASHLEALLAQEQRDGRFANDEAREGQRKSRLGYVALHRYDQKDLQHWMEKQTYLALGTLLLAAAAAGVDATPMEGFDARTLDAEFGLRDKGFTSVVVVSLGYRAEGDFNAKLPKSRLPAETVITAL